MVLNLKTKMIYREHILDAKFMLLEFLKRRDFFFVIVTSLRDSMCKIRYLQQSFRKHVKSVHMRL